ncbi:hypothetical protein HAX54_045801, partial [Datura stramonium]|nr:hypothetical protein [Datura stramonium]
AFAPTVLKRPMSLDFERGYEPKNDSHHDSWYEAMSRGVKPRVMRWILVSSPEASQGSTHHDSSD